MSRHAMAGNGTMPCPVLKPLSLLETRYIRVDRQVCILGAHPRVHLPLPSSMVSRAHALIVTDGTETYVRDLASSNGVYINGHGVREGRLRDGDLLCVGPFAFWWCARMPGPRPRNLSEADAGIALLTVPGERAPREMPGRTFVIGTRDECDLLLENTMVDSAHAVVYRRGGKFHVRDLNSRTGTFVNGRRIRDVELRRSDQIRIGLMLANFEPPAPRDPSTDGGLRAEMELTGIAGVASADHPLGDGATLPKTCPTIEQLLGAPPTRITHWDRRRFKERLTG
ncbi:MAG TPA: FHA domain-containing protein [Tepidisphaeraceae bacterium]|jgi:pSer/pThr/pTyr-binding forkhead associated (FHA) protein